MEVEGDLQVNETLNVNECSKLNLESLKKNNSEGQHEEMCDEDIRGSTSEIKSNMLSRVAMSDAHFKHQQRGEPDLTFKEKYEIAEEILSKRPSLFLSRFGQFLYPEDVEYFRDFQGDYEIDFYLKEILKLQDKVHSQKVVKNRRYAAMKELMDCGDYFSEDEMKWRNPLLYEEMIGKYLTEEEIQSKVDKTDLRFSNILLKHMDQIQENYLYDLQREAEECQEEEEEESEEENGEMCADDEETDDPKKPQISETEKRMLKAEFLQIMQERFMSGKDEDFDYSTVDKNTRYDSLETLDKDEEEKYFDEEEPHRIDSPFASYQMEQTDSPRRVNSPVVLPAPDTAVEHVEDYMTFDATGESDVRKAESELTKMSVTCPSESSDMPDNG